jgi:hypothetical protein
VKMEQKHCEARANLSLHQTRRSLALYRRFRRCALFFPRAGELGVGPFRKRMKCKIIEEYVNG